MLGFGEVVGPLVEGFGDPLEVKITTELPPSARKAGWVPTTRPTEMRELTTLPTTGENPAEARTLMAWATDSPATRGTGTKSPATLPLGSAKSRNGIPAKERSMIRFHVGAAMVAPKTWP